MSRFAFTYEDPSYSDDYDPDADWAAAQQQQADEVEDDEIYSPYYGA
jgi:hypothetical protein